MLFFIYIYNYIKGEILIKQNNRIYNKLFLSTFYLSAFTFGGGYVIVPLMKNKFVDELKYLEEEEMLNLIAIAQSSPGPVAVNASILVGYKVAGILGAIVTILGTILPPLIILSIVSLFYSAFRDNQIINAVLKGMQSGVAAVICDVVINLGKNVVDEKEFTSIIVMIGAFIATYFFEVNVVYIIIICGVIGGARVYLKCKDSEGDIK
ncbi:chromate transporter [Romboutsia sp. CE17]|uniref:chromate transporter n=1 Tax=Romboutsia sp. CE17 TaxID=2724150 RepID=UPI001442B2FD|nr:chromate transporter [Romboutsia sp. CE17]QJA07930.1 chromate transporter [Romboutsia sp. CE17]